MNEIKRIIDQFDQFSVLLHEIGHSSKELPVLIYEMYESNDGDEFDDWESYVEWLKGKISMMEVHVKKIGDLIEPTRRRYIEIQPALDFAKKFNARDVNLYLTINQFIELYGMHGYKYNRVSLQEWIDAHRIVNESKGQPGTYFIVKVEEMLLKKNKLKKPVFLQDMAGVAKQINGIKEKD